MAHIYGWWLWEKHTQQQQQRQQNAILVFNQQFPTTQTWKIPPPLSIRMQFKKKRYMCNEHLSVITCQYTHMHCYLSDSWHYFKCYILSLRFFPSLHFPLYLPLEFLMYYINMENLCVVLHVVNQSSRNFEEFGMFSRWNSHS